MKKTILTIILSMAVTTTVLAVEPVQTAHVTTFEKAIECLAAATTLKFEDSIVGFNDLALDYYKTENPKDGYEDWLQMSSYYKGVFHGKQIEWTSNYMMREGIDGAEFKETFDLRALHFYSTNCE